MGGMLSSSKRQNLAQVQPFTDTQDILRFLYVLRRLLRQYPHACACVSFAPHLCTGLWAGSGWVQKVGWVTDATISMSGFGGTHESRFHVCYRVMTAPQQIRR